MSARTYAVLGLLLLAASAHVSAQGQSTPYRVAGPGCVAREMWRLPLMVEGGRELYLEPVVFASSGDRVLLAGKPSYIFVMRAPGATAELESRHAVFGAVIEPNGTARAVPPPPINGGKATAVAASGVETGGWRIIFAEADSIPEHSQVATSYWYGFYDGVRWSELERLTGRDEVPVQYDNSSRLVQHGDTIMWAAVTRLPGSRRGVAIFERHAGVWTHHTPETAFASGVELVHTSNHGFVLSVLNGRLNDGRGFTTLFIHPRRSNWRLNRSIALGEDPTIVGGTVHFSDETGVATWFGRTEDSAGSRLELRAMVGAIFDRDEPILTVERDAAPQFAPVLGLGEAAWVTHHSNNSADSTDVGELRVVRRSGSGPEVLWRSAQPFLGTFVAAYSGADVLIVGPQLDRAHELLVSLMIRLRIECSGNKQPGG